MVITSGPRWPWIAHLNCREDHTKMFFSVGGRNLREEFKRNWRLNFKEFLFIHVMQVAIIYQSHVQILITASQKSFERSHRRNMPVKLFQNLASGFKEEFLRISSCLYSARSPPFLKRVTHETFL